MSFFHAPPVITNSSLLQADTRPIISCMKPDVASRPGNGSMGHGSNGSTNLGGHVGHGVVTRLPMVKLIKFQE